MVSTAFRIACMPLSRRSNANGSRPKVRIKAAEEIGVIGLPTVAISPQVLLMLVTRVGASPEVAASGVSETITICRESETTSINSLVIHLIRT